MPHNDFEESKGYEDETARNADINFDGSETMLQVQPGNSARTQEEERKDDQYLPDESMPSFIDQPDEDDNEEQASSSTAALFLPVDDEERIIVTEEAGLWEEPEGANRPHVGTTQDEQSNNGRPEQEPPLTSEPPPPALTSTTSTTPPAGAFVFGNAFDGVLPPGSPRRSCEDRFHHRSSSMSSVTANRTLVSSFSIPFDTTSNAIPLSALMFRADQHLRTQQQGRGSRIEELRPPPRGIAGIHSRNGFPSGPVSVYPSAPEREQQQRRRDHRSSGAEESFSGSRTPRERARRARRHSELIPSSYRRRNVANFMARQRESIQMVPMEQEQVVVHEDEEQQREQEVRRRSSNYGEAVNILLQVIDYALEIIGSDDESDAI